MAGSVTITGIEGMPEVQPGADLARLILDAIGGMRLAFESDDVLIVTQKIVSKAEGRFVELSDIEPSPLAVELATNWEKDARHVEVVLRETRRIVRMDHGVIISETKHASPRQRRR
jgi:coenzyme F420-0:L-glutamate ligase/coenzyme F420-1:gamma-L-glutamate ligase